MTPTVRGHSNDCDFLKVSKRQNSERKFLVALCQATIKSLLNILHVGVVCRLLRKSLDAHCVSRATNVTEDVKVNC